MVALELCDHGDVFDLVADHGDFLRENPDTVKNLFGQVVQAVKALHTETQYAHLDLKVDNLLIGNDFRVKLCDLGCATPIGEPIFKSLGTDDYMAPEVANFRST